MILFLHKWGKNNILTWNIPNSTYHSLEHLFENNEIHITLNKIEKLKKNCICNHTVRPLKRHGNGKLYITQKIKNTNSQKLLSMDVNINKIFYKDIRVRIAQIVRIWIPSSVRFRAEFEKDVVFFYLETKLTGLILFDFELK